MAAVVLAVVIGRYWPQLTASVRRGHAANRATVSAADPVSAQTLTIAPRVLAAAHPIPAPRYARNAAHDTNSTVRRATTAAAQSRRW
jgi:hypothetical protein